MQATHYAPDCLFSIDSNPKTIKGQKYGFLTGVMYLAPSDLSGYQVCAMAEIAQCAEGCLNSAGRGAFNSTQLARINKTKYFFEARVAFMQQLVRDITKIVNKAKKMGMTPLIRLNGTSDIKFENIAVNGAENIFALFPDVQFYDYTKIANRRNLPKNYDLTFSYSGVLQYQKYVNIALTNGMRIAAVFRTIGAIPKTFLGRVCVDGDNSDIRHLDPVDSVVALYAKGKAKKDTTGFVVDTFRTIALQVA